MLPGAIPQDIEGRLKEGRLVVVHDILSPINHKDVVEALKPEKPFGPPLYARVSSTQESWELAAQFQTEIIGEALSKGRDLVPRFAVFSLAPIPLAIHLGYLFSDRVEVKPFQFDRERSTWCWNQSLEKYDADFRIDGLPSSPIDDPVDVIIRVSLSARIIMPDSVEVAGQCPVQVDISVNDPDVMWLCHPKQLSILSGTFRAVLKDISRLVPQCNRLHLFYAGPTGGAIILGQAINPRMNPEVKLYEYDRRKSPRYEHVLTLG